MNTLEELKYYCEEHKPVGAMMLTGEWGCGKTYLLDNMLKEILKETHVLIRISLFGIASIDELRNEIKRSWLSVLAEANEQLPRFTEKIFKYGSMVKKVADKGTDILPEPLKAIASGVLSLNALDFVKIEPTMGDKKVILIFDDLERANISTGDLLGCINDYCENLHINTIIVANEEKIKPNDTDKIEYREIKEKIIQRTIQYRPDYSFIVSKVIDDIDSDLQDYKELLNVQKEEIIEIFSGQSVDGTTLDDLIAFQYSGKSNEDKKKKKRKVREIQKQRPHNIRSLKCALQDFKRVFRQLDKKKIDNKEKWLFSYLTYVLSFRAGLVVENSSYGTLFSDEKASILYPGYYNDRYITNSIKKWICHGEWNQNEIDTELEYIISREKAISPEEKIRINRLQDWEDKDIIEGYPNFLKKAYNGEISLDDYVNFLWNRCWGRKYEIRLPDVDWTKIYGGINRKMTELIQSGEEQPHHRMIIRESDKDYFLPEEWKAYEIIRTFFDNKSLVFESNKKIYVDIIKNDPINSYSKIQNKCFDRFDEEMAQATIIGFENASNSEKNQFISYFKNMWEVKIWSQDFKIDLPQNGLRRLLKDLKQLMKKYSQESLQISKLHTKRFIDIVLDLIKEQEKRVEEVEKAEAEKAEDEARAAKEREAKKMKKAEIADVVENLLTKGISVEKILEKLKECLPS